MRKLSCIIFGLALGMFVIGAVGAETFPSSAPVDEGFDSQVRVPDRSGDPNPLRLSTNDVSWGGSGPVGISFNMNQRARVWIAIYEVGSNATGPYGPNGAVARAVPQDRFVAVAPAGGADLEAGNNTITWDGLDWEGNAAGAGSYSFDVIAFNLLDPATLMFGGNSDFDDHEIDMRDQTVWTHRKGRYNSNNGDGPQNVHVFNLGTDLIANPNAFEEWDASAVWEVVEESGSRGGPKPDPDDPDIIYLVNSNWENEFTGIYKSRKNAAAKSLERVTEFGANGFADVPGPLTENAMQILVYNDQLISPNWSNSDPPASGLNFWDKNTGEYIKAFDVREFFLRWRVDDNGVQTFSGGGPSSVSADDSGLWLCGWRSTSIIKLDWDGNLIWFNGPGDLYSDQFSAERAAALGLTGPASGGSFQLSIRITNDRSGHLAVYSPRHNQFGNQYSVLGRDGAGILRVFMDHTKMGPFKASLGTHISWVDENQGRVNGEWIGPDRRDGPFDGIYVSGNWDLSVNGPAPERESTDIGGFQEMFHVPFDLAVGRLGAGATAVEADASAGTPDSYGLSEAYPNPFNPETAIDFSVPVDGYVSIDVFNTAGQLVATLVDKDLTAGGYKSTWDAKDQAGQPVSSGVYFYRMQAGDFSATHSMTLLK
jgi:hypothetical protein